MFEARQVFLKLIVQLCIVLLTTASCAWAAEGRSVLVRSQQVLVVTTAAWDSVTGTIQRYERSRAAGTWRKIGGPIAVTVGRGGMGWGNGVMAVPGHAATDPVKHEGDGKTPAGVFRVGTAFGYAAEKPTEWKLAYRPLTPATECVDDGDSKYYNNIVERTRVTPDWKSSEHMRAEGVYYEWGAVIEQNPENRPGDGSCVFLHVSDGGSTSGCTAMKKQELESVLGWLNPGDNPLIVEMPIAEYRRAAKILRLPAL